MPETLTRDEWLKTLDWREGKPPIDKGMYPPGIVVEFAGGTIQVVGDINQLGGVCDCCPERDPGKHEVRWAPLYRLEPTG